MSFTQPPPLYSYEDGLPLAREAAFLSSGSGSVAGARLLVLVCDVLELGVDDFLALRLVRSFRSAGGTAGRGACSCLGLLCLVHRLAQLHRGLGEDVGLVLDVLDVLALQRGLEGLKRAFDRRLLGRFDLVAELREVLARRV